MKFYRRLLFSFFCLLLIAPAIPVLAQQASLLADVSSSLRKDFRIRLTHLVHYQVNNDWEKIYDMSIDSVTDGGTKKGVFINTMKSTKQEQTTFLGFLPSASVLVNMYGESKVWSIEGCGKYRRKGRIVYIKSGLSAMLHKGKWYFDYVTIVPDAVGGAERPCKNYNRRSRLIRTAMYLLSPATTTWDAFKKLPTRSKCLKSGLLFES